MADHHAIAGPVERAAACDVLIVGAGPAGMTAALSAANSGADVILLDDNPAPGGQIWRDGPAAKLPRRALELREAIACSASIRLLTETRVVSLAGVHALLLEDPQLGWVQRYRALILCTGARELLLPFPGWTLPGVTGAGGLQAMIKAGLPVEGERIVIAGSGPLLLAAASTARRAGARVVRVAEQAGLESVALAALQMIRWPSKAWQALSLTHLSYRAASYVVAASGQESVESVRLAQGSTLIDVDCDRIACGYGLVPNTQLAQLLGCALASAERPVSRISVDEMQQTSIAGVFAAGECTGIGGSERALAQGAIAGHAAVAQLDQARRSFPARARWEAFAGVLRRRFALSPVLKTIPRPDTLVCRCEDVSHGTLASCEGWTEAKLSTRCGMGACQGRVCGAAAAFHYGWTPPQPQVPLSPTRLATLAMPSPQ